MATQSERRSATRAALLEAAALVLVDRGAAGFTTTEVARRAGLSQGAIFKHFATKADLLAAVVEEIFAGLVARYEGQFAATAATDDDDPVDRLGAALDLLWDIFQDERLLAAYDLFTAARTDPALQADLAPVVRVHVANLHALAEVLFAEAGPFDLDRLHDAVDLVAATMQGLVINRVAVADPAVEDRVRAMLHGWVADRLVRQEAGR